MGTKANTVVMALIVVLSISTSGFVAAQNADSEKGIVGAIQSAQASLQGDAKQSVSKSDTLASATTASIDPRNACEDKEGELIAKYEITEDGDFVYEKGYAGDVFDFTVLTTGDDGVLNFTWASTTPTVDQRSIPNSAPAVTFAYGKINGPEEGDYKESFDPPTTGPEEAPYNPDGEDPPRAYSNIQFCGGDFFQVELVSGSTVPETLTEPTFAPNDRLINAIYGSTAGTITHRGHIRNAENSECIEVIEEISISPNEDANATATIGVKATEVEGCVSATFTFVAYDLPDGAVGFATPQEKSDASTITIGDDLSKGESMTIEVELKDQQ